MAFCPLRWLHFHNLKQRGDHKQLVSNHFIDLKHAHMAVCLFFIKKKLYHCFVEKYRRNVEMEQDSNIQIPVQFFCPLREDEAWCADKCLSASAATARCSGNRSVFPRGGKTLTGMDSVFLTLTKCINSSDVMYLCDLIRGCLYWTHTAVND